jgi:hypothetical protein
MVAMRETAVGRHVVGHARPRLLECRYELALRSGIPTPDEHLMLTSDVQLHRELGQH